MRTAMHAAALREQVTARRTFWRTTRVRSIGERAAYHGCAVLAVLLVLTAGLALAPAASAQCPPNVPVQGAPPPGPLPVFPANNWWNLDIRSAPVDLNSAAYIAFINNGSPRHLHPDFGGEESPGSTAIYGMPYVLVDHTQALKAVTFDFWDQSDGVDYSTGQGIPFYPIPSEAIRMSHWVEGGAPATVDERAESDRHLLLIDCTYKYLYELYNVYYDSSQARWYAGSGAFFDMHASARRPDGWTSADAAGLAIFPGLVRRDEVYNDDVPEIGHALRVTVRATNGYVYPGSHQAGNTAGALPMGARLRLKTSVGGSDPALRTSDPYMRKIFRAMQTYGLIVADNGTDMYITGTFDTLWNNDILNPAFATLTASDFEVVQLGWNPPTGPVVLSTIGASPNPVVGGNAATGTVTFAAAAPTGGAVVTLSSASPQIAIPASVTVAQGQAVAMFPIITSVVPTITATTLSATYNGVSKPLLLTLNPLPSPSLASLVLNPTIVVGGSPSIGTVTLTAVAPPGGATVVLTTSHTSRATVPTSVVIAAGATSQTFTVLTKTTKQLGGVTVGAHWLGVTKTAALWVKRQ